MLASRARNPGSSPCLGKHCHFKMLIVRYPFISNVSYTMFWCFSTWIKRWQEDVRSAVFSAKNIAAYVCLFTSSREYSVKSHTQCTFPYTSLVAFLTCFQENPHGNMLETQSFHSCICVPECFYFPCFLFSSLIISPFLSQLCLHKSYPCSCFLKYFLI